MRSAHPALSALPPAELDEVLGRARLTRLTPRTLTDPARLRETIAVPIRAAGGNVIAAMNVSAHATRVSLEKLREEFLPLLRRAGREISAELARR